MNVIYARQPLPPRDANGLVANSLFLVGPTPREPRWPPWLPRFLKVLDWRRAAPSWRPEALRILAELGFTGTVFVPEDQAWTRMNLEDHTEQIWWEVEALGCASCVAIWLDRELKRMPAFTTNSEWGFLIGEKPERLVMGLPKTAQKVGYHREISSDVARFKQAFGKPAPVKRLPTYETMEEMLRHAAQMAAA